MYQAIPTFHIASDEKLVGGVERGQQAHISPLLLLASFLCCHILYRKLGRSLGLMGYYSYINYMH